MTLRVDLRYDVPWEEQGWFQCSWDNEAEIAIVQIFKGDFSKFWPMYLHHAGPPWWIYRLYLYGYEIGGLPDGAYVRFIVAKGSIGEETLAPGPIYVRKPKERFTLIVNRVIELIKAEPALTPFYKKVEEMKKNVFFLTSVPQIAVYTVSTTDTGFTIGSTARANTLLLRIVYADDSREEPDYEKHHKVYELLNAIFEREPKLGRDIDVIYARITSVTFPSEAASPVGFVLNQSIYDVTIDIKPPRV